MTYVLRRLPSEQGGQGSGVGVQLRSGWVSNQQRFVDAEGEKKQDGTGQGWLADVTGRQQICLPPAGWVPTTDDR
ncbi:hypothetical protein VFPFJ_03572 [Purpureocillium lilacinum]|uniref:Uncharacterized protein n=1 Tax=Purpureocillium lilacinum TaxID=33203 RepID=A0A179HPQ6_PURLI|nr:hypothetical protein VFPFJ_03572 [Purpureocillium lilacinum]OAQ91832.1 hypothetical protein VFPFJ_03572 [Purpureocillium lilacinum]